MAKIVSHVWSSARGSIAGITYLTTPSGAIIARQRVIPSDAPTPQRTIVKSALIQAAGAWTAMSLANKTAWNIWGIANPPGTGRQQFIASQSFQTQGDLQVPTGWPVGMVVDLSPPTISGHPSYSWVATTPVIPATTAVAFKFRNSSAYKVCFIAEISAAYGNGRNYYKGPYVPASNAAKDVAAGAQFVVEFAGLTAGKRYFTRVRAFSFDATVGNTGRVVGTLLRSSSIAILVP